MILDQLSALGTEFAGNHYFQHVVENIERDL